MTRSAQKTEGATSGHFEISPSVAFINASCTSLMSSHGLWGLKNAKSTPMSQLAEVSTKGSTSLSTPADDEHGLASPVLHTRKGSPISEAKRHMET